MGWFSRKPTQEDYNKAVVNVATNLYLLTTSPDSPHELRFKRPDSRFRYLAFCLVAVVSTTLAYDEKKRINPSELINACCLFLTWIAQNHPSDYFDAGCDANEAALQAEDYLRDFAAKWSLWPSFENQSQSYQFQGVIAEMIHSIETGKPYTEEDEYRLRPLALQIDCQLLTMREAVVGLASK